MDDPTDCLTPVPSPKKRAVLTVTLRQHRGERFELEAATVQLFADGMIGGAGFRGTAVQDAAYFAALDAWLPEQDHREPYRDRLQRFQRLYEGGGADRTAR